MEIKHRRFDRECGHEPVAHYKREYVSVCAVCEKVDVIKASFEQHGAFLRALGEDNAAAAAGVRWNDAIVAWMNLPEGHPEKAAAFEALTAAQTEAEQILILQQLPHEPGA